MKVKIVKSSLNTYWYNDHIGDIVEVRPEARYQLMGSHNDTLDVADCKVVEEDMKFCTDINRESTYINVQLQKQYKELNEFLSNVDERLTRLEGLLGE